MEAAARASCRWTTGLRGADRPDGQDCPGCVSEILSVRHHSLFAPRDFDVLPYFQVVKPTFEAGFDFHVLKWGEQPGGSILTCKFCEDREGCM